MASFLCVAWGASPIPLLGGTPPAGSGSGLGLLFHVFVRRQVRIVHIVLPASADNPQSAAPTAQRNLSLIPFLFGHGAQVPYLFWRNATRRRRGGIGFIASRICPAASTHRSYSLTRLGGQSSVGCADPLSRLRRQLPQGGAFVCAFFSNMVRSFFSYRVIGRAAL
jgi:hypothetical protein